ncbi:MAG: hypothetical protein HY515_04760 [Candidatus Aenigmarchaeota archaeon]|nr:hypothetical protein [Candidatus Aenigmarchaeota archaeon]
MLAKTSEVLERAGVSSLKQLRLRLYQELDGATTADVLNHCVGNIFSSASKSISMAINNGNATDREILRETARIVSAGGFSPSDVATHKNGYFFARKLSDKPGFMEPSKTGEPIKYKKTLLGGMLGDVFAVKGIYAGADNEFEFPLASALGLSFNSFGLATPLLSLLMLEWATEERENYSLSRFARDSRLLDGSGQTIDYVSLEKRLRVNARRLADRDLLVYESTDPGSNIYAANGRLLSPGGISSESSGLSVGVVDVAVKVFKAIKRRKASAEEIAGQLFYGVGYIQHILRWLVDNGYAEIYAGSRRDERSSMLGTARAHRLSDYLNRPLSILGFNPGTNPAGVWKRPRIDVEGLVRYREELIGPLHIDPNSRAAFEAACRTAYQRHFAYLGRNRKNHT